MDKSAKTYTARWVWCGPGDLRMNAAVVIESGRISQVADRAPAGLPPLDLGEGLLLPGLVNAHTHLELSGLAGLVPPAGDFVDWLLEMVSLRPDQLRTGGAEASKRAVADMVTGGTALVGDITNTGKARADLAEAELSAVSLWEALGSAKAQPPPPEFLWRGACLEAVAVAAHAPYSVPARRLQVLKALAGTLPFCMHLAESVAEMEFTSGVGAQGKRLEEFLDARGVRRDDLGLTAPRPLGHLLALGLLDEHTLLVHGVQLDQSEVPDLAASGASLCVCPRSNLGLTGSLAPLEELMAAGVNLALGTDSLASCPDLSLWREMSALAQAKPVLTPEAILTMATAGGAKALGLGSHFGAIKPGAAGPLAFVGLERLPKNHVLDAVVQGQHAEAPISVGRD
jgi:aminodeoxyfutalosine deaminase